MSQYKLSLPEGNGALQASPPVPLARRSRLTLQSRRSLSWTRRSQYDAAEAFSCARRCSNVTRCVIDRRASVWPVMSSVIKPEVNNISQRRQRRTEPRQKVTYAGKKSDTDWTCSSGDMPAERYRNRHAHHHTPLSSEGRSKMDISWRRRPVGGGADFRARSSVGSSVFLEALRYVMYFRFCGRRHIFA